MRHSFLYKAQDVRQWFSSWLQIKISWGDLGTDDPRLSSGQLKLSLWDGACASIMFCFVLKFPRWFQYTVKTENHMCKEKQEKQTRKFWKKRSGHFIPFYRLPFHSVVFFAVQSFPSLVQSHLSIFAFVVCAFGVISKKPLPNPMS